MEKLNFYGIGPKIGIVLLPWLAVTIILSCVKKGLKETRLVTNGAFSLCQNPLYSSIILFIIPALSLILNSWLILTSSITGYILFRKYIKKEYNELEKKFGESYLKYKKQTPEFFPVPLKKK